MIETWNCMKLHTSLLQKDLFCLFTAPVAKGKTRSILELYQENILRIVFVSPLRALANEIKEKLKTEKNIYLLGEEEGHLTNKEKCINFLTKKKSMIITTVELLEDDFLEMIELESDPILFVLDEFHLFYQWGESFRPILFDKFLAMLNTSHPMIALSATMNEEVMEKLKFDLNFNFEYWVHLNWGNLELYRLPTKTRVFNRQETAIIERAFRRELKAKKPEEVFLYFCQYRQEVDDKLQWAKRNGYKAIGCVGGEVVRFQKELNEHQGPLDCIFSTIALSHGVNLPEIRKVFIGYEVKNYDLWLQMVGRGGRQGSEYQIYTFDNFEHNQWRDFLKYIKIKIEDVFDCEF